MHITVSRVLGLLLFLALIGYAFVVGPRISALSLRPALGTGSAEIAPSSYAGPHMPVHIPRFPAE